MSQLTLKCEKFGLSRGLHDLLTSGDLVDVTLACQGQYIQAHKTVLAACSPHFRSLFKLQPWQQPIVFLQDVELAKLEALVDFMYNGEVTVQQEDLAGLLRLAEALKVTGLTSQNKSSAGELLTTDVQPKTLLSHPPPPPPTPPPAKIARRSNNCDVSKRATSPELEEVQTTSVQTTSQVEQPPHAEQSWVPAIDNRGSLVQDTRPPCSQASGSIAAEQVWVPQTVYGLAEESLQTSASYMMNPVAIKVEQEERDLSEDQGSTNMQGCDAEEEEEDSTSHLADQTSLQGGSWCEAGPSSTEPSTSGLETSTSRLTSTSDEQPSQRAAVPGVSNTGGLLMERDVEPKDNENESNDEDTRTRFFCQDCNFYFNCARSLQGHISRTHNKDCQLEEATLRCDFCPNKYYRSNEGLCRHYREHHPTVQRFSCKICTAKFSNYHEFKQHKIDLHGKELYPYVCTECGKQYIQNTRLKQHLKSAHGKEMALKRGTNLSCRFCYEMFQTLHLKKQHIAQQHPESCFKCPWCPRVFHDKYQVATHQRKEHVDKC